LARSWSGWGSVPSRELTDGAVGEGAGLDLLGKQGLAGDDDDPPLGEQNRRAG
jgi:hypothetical protein